MSKRYAMVDQSNGKIVNCIIWDGVTRFTPPAGLLLVRHDECDVDDYWDCHKEELHKICRMANCEHVIHRLIDPEAVCIKPHTHRVFSKHQGD